MRKTRILVLCPYPENTAGSQRLKYEQYLGYLRERGFEIHVAPFMTRPLWRIVYERGHLGEKVLWTLFGYARRIVDLARLPFYDGAYVSLWVTPFGTSLFERVTRLASRKLIYDIEDLAYLGATSEANRIIAPIKGRQKCIDLMKCANHVVVSTPYLEAFARRHNPRTTEIALTIDTDKYVPVNAYSNARVPIIGWTGTHSTVPYLRTLDRVLVELRKRLEFKLLAIGAPPFRLPGIEVETIPWRVATEVRDLQRIDIGLYPLRDEHWIQGKCGGKLFQYMALGIPMVASALGTTPRVIDDGVSGFLARTEAEWLEHLERLLRDPVLRRSMGRAGRAGVEANASLHANAPRYLEVFEGVYRART